LSRAPRLGEILVQEGLIDAPDLEVALAERERFGNRLARTLVSLGLVEEPELVRVLSRRLGVPAARLEGKRIDPEVLALVPRELAERHGCLPLFTKREGGVEVLYLGMEEPGDLEAIDEVSFRAGLKVRPVTLPPSQLWASLERSYEVEAGSPASGAPLAETPVDSGDTAPLLNGALLQGPSATDDRTAAPPTAPPAPEAPPADLLSEGLGEGSGAERAPRLGPDGKPRDVPTRTILRAVTQLLLEKQILRRDELLERVRALAARDE
jgi:hypothetical protein